MTTTDEETQSPSESKGQWLVSLVAVFVLAALIGAVICYIVHSGDKAPAAGWATLGAVVTILGALVAPPPESRIKKAYASGIGSVSAALADFIKNLGDGLGKAGSGAGRFVKAVVWVILGGAFVLLLLNVILNDGLFA